jgi:hypothetical protein
MKIGCSKCETTREVSLVEKNETVTFKGLEVEFSAMLWKCSVCGGLIDNMDTMQTNLDRARAAADLLARRMIDKKETV